MHSLLVRRARWANVVMRRHSLRASTIFVHAQKCALSSTHEGGRQTRAERVGPAPDTRETHAGYSLCARRLVRREHPAHTWRPSNACLTDTQTIVGVLNEG